MPRAALALRTMMTKYLHRHLSRGSFQRWKVNPPTGNQQQSVSRGIAEKQDVDRLTPGSPRPTLIGGRG